MHKPKFLMENETHNFFFFFFFFFAGVDFEITFNEKKRDKWNFAQDLRNSITDKDCDTACTWAKWISSKVIISHKSLE